MSGTGYTDPSYVKTAVCSKCEGHKTWNYWYHMDDSLCDDCYYVGGKYKDLTKEEAMKIEKSLDSKGDGKPTIFNADVRHEIGKRVYIKCGTCCMITEQIIIPSTHTDTQASQCTECQGADEWII